MRQRKYLSKRRMRGLFLSSACVCVLAVGVICVFLFANDLPFFRAYSPVAFPPFQEDAP